MYRLVPFLLMTLAAAEPRTGIYRGRAVVFQDQDGYAIYQGDIILGRTADVETSSPAASKLRPASTVTSTRSLWPGGVIPYQVDGKLSAALQSRLADAIGHWNAKTPIRLRTYAGEADYVYFTVSPDPNSCSSSVGRTGGPQLIRLPEACGTGSIIHEIGHTVGLWHEQSRDDRNAFVTVIYDNLDKDYSDQFDQVLSAGQDQGAYDYNSIMHYGAYAYSKNTATLTSLETVPAGIPIGQRNGLSAGDIDAVSRLYGAIPTRLQVATTPSGLSILVDGASVDDGATFDWPAGSTHTVSAPSQGDGSTLYVFGSWSDGGAASHTWTADPRSTVLTANFVRQRKIVVGVQPAGSGTAAVFPVAPDGFYTERTNIELSAQPNPGRAFQQWSSPPNRSANPKNHVVAGPLTITATFAGGPLTTFLSDPPGRLVIVDGVSASTPYKVAWTPGSEHLIDVDTTQPDWVRFVFAGWADAAGQQRVVTAGSSDATYTARFSTFQRLRTADPGSLGRLSIIPPSADGYYADGTTVNIQATPLSGLFFRGWGGDLNGRANPAALLMNDQKQIQANFAVSVPEITAVSAATGLEGAIAPGEIVVVYGTNLGPPNLTTLQVSNGAVATQLAGTQVVFDDRPAPVIYTSANQVSAVAPYGISGSTRVYVTYNGRSTAGVVYPVDDSMPGLFTAGASGVGQAAALNQDGTVNSASRPAGREETIVLYATGEGATNPAGSDGRVAIDIFPKPALPVSVRIGGLPAVVQYAGAAPGFVAGLMQVNAQIPAGVKPGPGVPVQVIVGNAASPSGVTIAVK